jgi:pimeloyl-ACP methyl ester carboxylesterase/DNA-binding SARP family transcriptional activator
VDARTGRGRLRRLAHQANATLGQPLVLGDGDALWLAPGCTSDLQRTRAAIDRGDPLPLLEPGCEGLLEGFEPDGEGFADWRDQTRRQHRAAVQRALEAAAGQAAKSDRAERAGTAQALAARLLQIDACSEAGHAALLAARAALGDAAGVETAYHDAAARLREELGVRPSARLEQAYVEATRRLAAQAEPWPIATLSSAHGDIAYTQRGSGPTAIVILWGMVSNVEVALDEPRARAMLDRLAARHRVVMLDRRGTGLSERLDVVPDAQAAAQDLCALLDHLGIARAWLFGASVGGTLALDFALRHRDRCAGLLLAGTSPCGAWSPDWPWALRAAQVEAWAHRLTDPDQAPGTLRRFAPSVADDPAVRAWYGRLLRHAATRRGALAGLRAYHTMDLRPRLPALRGLPTLVMQRRGDRVVPLEAGRWLARAIPGARFEPLAGDDHFHWYGDSAAVCTAIEGFVATAADGLRRAA